MAELLVRPLPPQKGPLGLIVQQRFDLLKPKKKGENRWEWQSYSE